MLPLCSMDMFLMKWLDECSFRMVYIYYEIFLIISGYTVVMCSNSDDVWFNKQVICWFMPFSSSVQGFCFSTVYQKYLNICVCLIFFPEMLQIIPLHELQLWYERTSVWSLWTSADRSSEIMLTTDRERWSPEVFRNNLWRTELWRS